MLMKLVKPVIALADISVFVLGCAAACVIALFSFSFAVEFLEVVVDDTKDRLAKHPC